MSVLLLAVSVITYYTILVEPVVREEKAKPDKTYVMISYNWAEQKAVMALKDELVKNGINVSISHQQSCVRGELSMKINSVCLFCLLLHNAQGTELQSFFKVDRKLRCQILSRILPLKFNKYYSFFSEI